MTEVYIKGKLPSCNEYIEACRVNAYKGAKMKKETESFIGWQIIKMPKIEGAVIIHFEWHEATMKRDKDNVCFAKKFILDALQKTGKLRNDSSRYIAGFSDSFIYGDGQGVKLRIEAVDKKVRY